MKYSQLKQYVIEPELIDLGHHSASATQILVLTAVVETGAGKYLHQLNGPALGIFQMEPATHDSIWKNYLAHKDPLAKKVKRVSINTNAKEMIWNLRYAAAMARVFYVRIPEALPKADDVHGLAQYYKTYYNTSMGASQVDKSIKEYKAYIGSAS